MSNNEHASLSAEQLNAFIDDELAFEEREQIFKRMEQDPQLCQEAHDLGQLRAMLRNAYRNPPQPQVERKTHQAGRLLPNAVAAGLLLLVGALFGWLTNAQLGGTELNAGLLNTAGNGQNILLHLNSNEPQKMAVALDYAEQLLNEHRQQGAAFKLELLANEGGTELLRRDTSPYAQRIQQLQSKYSNVSFRACSTALERLREQGVKVELLSGTQIDGNAIDMIVRRMEEGWQYRKI